jgi:6,7-dimethyl-8-ribityllumazine synthase
MNAIEMASLMRQLHSDLTVETYNNNAQSLPPASLKNAIAKERSPISESSE